MDLLPRLPDLATIVKLLGSLLALVVVVAVRALLAGVLHRTVSAPELRRRWLASIRTALFIVFVLALISIWAETIQTFAVSIIAVAVAFAIVTKELSMCLLGSFVRMVGDSYRIGDRVEIGTHRGDVIDQNLLTTMLLELATGTASQQHTGRTIALPNSILLATPVTKESQATPYSLHLFVVPVQRDEHLDTHLRMLLDAANTACAPFLDDVRSHWKRLAAIHDVTESSPEPHVAVEMSVPDQLNLVVRIPSPIGGQAKLQEAIVHRFLAAQRRLETARPNGTQ